MQRQTIRVMKTNNEILNELKEIAPVLSKLDKPKVDEIPANYFTSFPDKFLKKLHEEELKEIAPTLSTLKKVNVGTVPANYFKSFPTQMQKRISAEQTTKLSSGIFESLNTLLENIAAVIFKPNYSVAFAGAASLMIVGMLTLTKIEQCTDLDCKLASLSDKEINAYLSNNSDFYFEDSDNSTFDLQAFNDISDDELSNAIFD